MSGAGQPPLNTTPPDDDEWTFRAGTSVIGGVGTAWLIMTPDGTCRVATEDEARQIAGALAG